MAQLLNHAAIAVIVPVYNNAATVQRCIDSILGQTDRNLELILVDDGSKDESGALCDAAAARDARVRVIHKANEGLMATWMRGVRETTAPYLSFVDADDWIEPDMLASMRSRLSGRRRAREMVCCGYVVDREWDGTSERHDNGASPGVYEGEKLQKELKNGLLGNETRKVIASRCMKIFSRELIEENLHFCNPSIRMGEDLNITTSAMLDADRIVLLGDAYYYHYVFYHNSMVHAYDPGMYDNIVLLRRCLLDILMAKGVPDALEMTEREYLFLMCIEMKNELRCTIGPSKDVIGRIQDICAQEHTGELVHFYPERIRDNANRIIVWMLCNPTRLRVRTARRIFLAQARRGAKAATPQEAGSA